MAVDRQSATAMYLRGFIEELMKGRSKSLERPGYDWDKTQVLRGELAALKKVYQEVSLTPEQETTNESD